MIDTTIRGDRAAAGVLPGQAILNSNQSRGWRRKFERVVSDAHEFARRWWWAASMEDKCRRRV